MRPAVAALLAALVFGGAREATGQPPGAFWLDVVARAASGDAPPSWLDDGTGRLGLGDEEEDLHGSALGEAQLGAELRAGDRFAAHLHARARAQSAGDAGDVAGVVEAWAEVTASPRAGADRLRLRGGQLFLPTSRENVAPLWSSPYTLTLSALNSWIGEEVRPIGLLADYEIGLDSTRGLRAGASVFGGNDASGALLAWRGWSLGDRLSTLGETLPLPALPSLAEGGLFEKQDRDGTTPLAGDLDGRPGWAGYLRGRQSDLGLVQVTHVDNRGDRELHHGEYAWDTRFDLAAVELHPGVSWTIAGELLRGETAMGVPTPRADVDFHAGYLLVSWQRGALRTTGRWDRFGTHDRDRQPRGERSDEHGHAWVAAILWQATPALSVGGEYVDARVEREALAGPGRRNDGGRALTVGVRYRIGSTG